MECTFGFDELAFQTQIRRICVLLIRIQDPANVLGSRGFILKIVSADGSHEEACEQLLCYYVSGTGSLCHYVLDTEAERYCRSLSKVYQLLRELEEPLRQNRCWVHKPAYEYSPPKVDCSKGGRLVTELRHSNLKMFHLPILWKQPLETCQEKVQTSNWLRIGFPTNGHIADILGRNGGWLCTS